MAMKRLNLFGTLIYLSISLNGVGQQGGDRARTAVAAAAFAESPIGKTVPYHVEVVATDLRVPWSIVFTPDGRLLFAERPGRVRVIKDGKLEPEPLLTLPDVDNSGKLGLMGMTLHPEFERNHWLYLAYAYKEGAGQRVRVVRYQETSQTLSERKVIIEDIPAATNHAGCRLKFGPDAKLYITTGDADKPELAQRLDSLAGKTLRVNDDGSVPRDNPFVTQKDARTEIWSYGHRNSQGLDWQFGSNLLFESEHGPNGGDEINIVGRGRNYGWPVIHHKETSAGMEMSLLEYTPSIAPSCALFYQGSALPQFRGNLLVACLRGECILRVVLDGSRVVSQERLLEKKHGRIREVAQAPDGTIYFSTSQHDPPEGQPRPGFDQILRLVPD